MTPTPNKDKSRKRKLNVVGDSDKLKQRSIKDMLNPSQPSPNIYQEILSSPSKAEDVCETLKDTSPHASNANAVYDVDENDQSSRLADHLENAVAGTSSETMAQENSESDSTMISESLNIDCSLNTPPVQMDSKLSQDRAELEREELLDNDELLHETKSHDTITSLDEPHMECELSPDIVKYIQSSTPESSQKKINQKGVRKSLKKNKNDSITEASEPRSRKPTKTEISESSLFIHNTIEEYDKHLKTSQALKGILEDESLTLLSKWALMSDCAKKVVSNLFCVEQNQLESIIQDDLTNTSTDIEEIRTYLSEMGFITCAAEEILSIENCSNVLTLPDLVAVCSYFKLRNPHSKPEAELYLKNYANTKDIKLFLNNTIAQIAVDKTSEVLNKLNSKLEVKLSENARETFNELIVLMHLDNIFKMGCTIDCEKVYNDRPGIKFKAKNTKLYPVDKTMIVDNASIIFQDRQEFCGYLKALAILEKYKTPKIETEAKVEMVEQTLQLYTDAMKTNISRYMALPIWLRRFTPPDLYLNVLEDGVMQLNTSKRYKKAIEILDLLISQVVFRQHKKPEWYDRKANIQHTYLKSPEMAAETLCQAFEDGLPEETVNNLRIRANKLLELKTRNEIDVNRLSQLSRVDKRLLEKNVPDPKKIYHQSDPKNKSSRRPKYDGMSAEIFCCKHYIKEGFTMAEHWEGKVVKTIYFLLFWDIIFTKPFATRGIFLSHYQQYPLDMFTEYFYLNRKTIIDGFLKRLAVMTEAGIIELLESQYEERIKCDVPDVANTVDLKDLKTVIHCLGSRALAAICRRFANNYELSRNGFPDLTLCNTAQQHNDIFTINHSIEFREVKTDKDNANTEQLQWLFYLNKHNIKAGLCLLRNKKVQDDGNSQRSDTETEASCPN